MTSVFQEKSSMYKENQKVRKMELEAIAKAIEIISNPNVADSYAGHIKFAQVPNFLQLSTAQRRAVLKDKAMAILTQKARALNSKTLANLVAQMKANSFTKIIDMIKELIAKLKEEAAAEADHKAWCDKELMDNKHKRNKKTTESEKITAEIEEMTAQIDTMAKEIQTLIQEQEDLTKAMGDVTAQRTAERLRTKQQSLMLRLAPVP